MDTMNNKDEVLTVALGKNAYDIHIGIDTLGKASSAIPLPLKGRKVFVLTDEIVGDFYADMLLKALNDQGAICHLMTVEGGEASKSLSDYDRLSNEMLSHKVSRDSVLITLGGGVVGDLGGFLASTIVRGIPYVQIPTTLLAQVDSSVGGKTAINTTHGKNLIGTFYQPKSVIIDLNTLKTLPARQYKAGLAEVVKYGIISNRTFFDYLNANSEALNDMNPDVCQEIVLQSCKAKSSIVAQDEKETKGMRALLNLGHTFGHALELLAGYNGDVLHGEAVSVGMVMAAQLSCDLGMIAEDDVACVSSLLEKLGIPTTVKGLNMSPCEDEIYNLMLGDKKATKDGIGFIVLNGIGDACVRHDISKEQVLLSLNKCL